VLSNRILAQLTTIELAIGELALNLDRKLGAIMTQQDELNADVQTLNTALVDVQSKTGNVLNDIAAIQAEIQQLQQNNPSLDLSGLDSLASTAANTVTGLDNAVSGLDSIAPPPPAGSAQQNAGTEAKDDSAGNGGLKTGNPANSGAKNTKSS